jgi:hypothetical protein
MAIDKTASLEAVDEQWRISPPKQHPKPPTPVLLPDDSPTRSVSDSVLTKKEKSFVSSPGGRKSKVSARSIDEVSHELNNPAKVFGLDNEKKKLHQRLQRMAETKSLTNGAHLWHQLRKWLGFESDMPTLKDLTPHLADGFGGVKPSKSTLVRFVDGAPFNMFCVSIIMFNCAWIGYATDVTIKGMIAIPPEAERKEFRVVGRIFTGWFLLEVIFRIAALRRLYFKRHDAGWNIYDLVVVSISVLEEIVDFLNLNFLRVLRVLRMVRVFRVVRLLRYFHGLRLMIVAVVSCSVTLLWALLSITFLMYICGVTFLQAATSYVDRSRTVDLQTLSLHFGSLTDTMYSLLLAISAGI